jgi:hypothetical protein
MAIDHRIGSKVIKNARREEAAGTRVEPYPYVGIVKNNLDPTRSGRLQVFIPDLGGPPDDPNNWRTVSYASPFQGYTTQTQSSTDRSSTDNKFRTVNHTYGMWMVPPDIGIEVIVLFIAGDPLRGYWVACVNSNLSHYMMPALAGTPNVDPNSLSAEDKKSYKKGDQVPVVEFNEYTKDFTNQAFYNNNKPIHEWQYNILRIQGLEKDPVRGAISSSSQRESPSHVFGISTPGRPIDDPADNPQAYQEQLASGNIEAKYLKTKTRKGGHVFVMDDGATLGEDQLIRLRTASGHQLLMNDTNDVIYIGHADGGSWIELAADGGMKVYTSGSYSVRAEGDINLHADGDINMQAGKGFNIKSTNYNLNADAVNIHAGAFKLQSLGIVSLKAGGELIADSGGQLSLKAVGKIAADGSGKIDQSGVANSGKDVTKLTQNSLPDVAQDSTGTWTASKKISSIVNVAPTHEPYPRNTTSVVFKPSSPGIQPGEVFSGTVDAIKAPATTQAGVTGAVPDKFLRDADTVDTTVGNLSKDQMSTLLTQIAFSESSCDYSKTAGNYLGRYMFGREALQQAGYIKKSVQSNAEVHNPNSWTGKDSIDSQDAWLAAHQIQDNAMIYLLQQNYTQMCKSGAITADMPPEDVGGMLMVAHLLGADGANSWRMGKGGSDANGTTGETYFNRGKYAVSVLAPKFQPIQQG